MPRGFILSTSEADMVEVERIAVVNAGRATSLRAERASIERRLNVESVDVKA